ncbi:hypothetical protein BCR24_12745 [Enterococcus ureilyticus]|uniref:Uncharacterized protein n=1 Tax=Enterococcus ureilyticus TaxID=1131292 RepID=A0A1E5HDZ4_9ENTE|nr:hypothetical protein [Enterococcus ureilyticus]MBM7689810.1 hypothetical protein [Enterococcus ureilyticus]MBO0446068.1 hypothetical protein [Enterococcus ureilyticus]OEG23177.1 hypothetical protein BCR24_12745 [Enterococcus ureilyticus]
MLSEINTTLNKVNDALDVNVSLPTPNDDRLAKASAVNFLLGTTAFCYGLLSKKKSYCVIGGLSVLSALFLNEEIGRDK